MTDREKVNAFLDYIGETDAACRAETLGQCASDKEVRAYFVGRFNDEVRA